MVRGLPNKQERGLVGKKTRVLGSHLRPHWFSHNNRFWYQNHYEGGTWEFILVDAIKGTRQLAFDHERLALSLQKATKKLVFAHCLPVESLEWDEEEEEKKEDGVVTFSFTSAKKRWRCNPRTYHLHQLCDDNRLVDVLPNLTEPYATTFTGDESAIHFINNTLGTVHVFWIDTCGQRLSYGTLEAGEQRIQHTYEGHVWLLQDDKAVNLAVFEGAAEKRAAVIHGVESPVNIRLPVLTHPHATHFTGDESAIIFVNRMMERVLVFWIDSYGQKRSYGSLEAGERRRQHTYAGHMWLLQDVNGVPLAAFEASGKEGEAVVDGLQNVNPWPTPDDHISCPGPVSDSPNGKWTAFVRDANIHVRSRTSGKVYQLSHDGKSGDSYDDKLYWSPDGTCLVGLRTRAGDSRKVHTIESSPSNQIQPKLKSYDYLKPGDQIPQSKPHLFNVVARTEVRVSDALFSNPWSIMDVWWRSDSKQFMFIYNQRGHQILRIVSVDAITGLARAIVNEESKTFIDYQGKHFCKYVDETNEIIWMSERDGWNHLYRYNGNSGAILNQITKGSWVIRGISRVDVAARQIYFQASGMYAKQDPYHVHYGRVNFDGSNLVWLTESDGTHSIVYSPDRRFVIDTYSRVDLPPQIELRGVEQGEKVCDLELVEPAASTTKWRHVERFVAKGRDGETEIWGVIYRPASFQAHKKYPVIEHIYAGPQSSFAPKSFDSNKDEEWELADLGFIVVRIDGMGTSNRSKAFHNVCWKNLADSGFPDRILWMKALAKKYPYMDLSRVGIYGSSAGGQSSLRALLAHPEFYHVAASDCGCHDNRMDKIWWNELYMGWPVAQHYEEQSNVTNAHKLQGKLLLTVGELDNNVDPASTMQVVDALIKADRDFDLIVVPGAGHGAGGLPYAARRRRDFFVRHLLGLEQEVEQELDMIGP